MLSSNFFLFHPILLWNHFASGATPSKYATLEQMWCDAALLSYTYYYYQQQLKLSLTLSLSLLPINNISYEFFYLKGRGIYYTCMKVESQILTCSSSSSSSFYSFSSYTYVKFHHRKSIINFFYLPFLLCVRTTRATQCKGKKERKTSEFNVS